MAVTEIDLAGSSISLVFIRSGSISWTVLHWSAPSVITCVMSPSLRSTSEPSPLALPSGRIENRVLHRVYLLAVHALVHVLPDFSGVALERVVTRQGVEVQPFVLVLDPLRHVWNQVLCPLTRSLLFHSSCHFHRVSSCKAVLSPMCNLLSSFLPAG